MPVFALEIRAVLFNVSKVSTAEDFSWSFELVCERCGERTKAVTFHADEEVELTRGAKANLSIKCKACGRKSDITIRQRNFEYQNSGEFGKLMTMECRGTSPDVWHQIEPLVITGENGFVFEDAEIEDGEFYGYDEQLNQEASVTEFEYRIVRSK